MSKMEKPFYNILVILFWKYFQKAPQLKKASAAFCVNT